MNGERYSRSLSRQNGTTVLGGEPYLEDAELAGLFAFLLESNDARRAVERGDGLYDVIMRRIDTDEIDGGIERLEADRHDLAQTLRELEDLEPLEADAGELEASAAELTAAVDALETDGQDERLALNFEVHELEFELDRLESQLDDVTNKIDEIEAQLTGRDDVKARRNAIDEEIEQRRSRIERLEQESVEQFNGQTETILDLLGFENLQRVWIERRETTVEEGRRTVNKTTFDLHVVRSSEPGAVYEDSIDHLSESERELV